MSSFTRLLELAGLLKEDMTMQQATYVLRNNGIDPNNPDDDKVRSVMRTKPAEVAREIATAYRYIRSPAGSQTQQKKPEAVDKSNAGPPVWAMGSKDWQIRKENMTDANFFRKTLWELSGKPTSDPLTIWSFDGKDLNQHIQVLAKPNIHKEIAKAMDAFTHGKSKAIFMSGSKTDKFVLIYLQGRVLDEPVVMSHKSSNKNPSNDWNFIGELPRQLAGIQRDFETKQDFQPSDFKAWINVGDSKVLDFPVDKSYYDGLRTLAKEMGVLSANSYLHMRLMAERNGWVAAGVNVGDDGQVGAVITAMSPAQGLKGARILFTNQHGGGKAGWNTLTIKTNDGVVKLEDRDEIINYLKTGKKQSSTVYV